VAVRGVGFAVLPIIPLKGQDWAAHSIPYVVKDWLEGAAMSGVEYSRTPLIRTLVIRIANYPNHLGRSGKFVENSTQLTWLEITGYRIKYNTVLWL